MRKYIPLALLALMLLSCGKEPISSPAKEEPVVKTVTYQVFAARDYSGDYYRNTQVDVKLTVGTIDKRTGVATIVWDTTFPQRSLPLFPREAQMYVVEKSIPVYESSHTLNSSYSIKYNTDGLLQQEFFGEGIGQGQKTLRVEVSL